VRRSLVATPKKNFKPPALSHAAFHPLVLWQFETGLALREPKFQAASRIICGFSSSTRSGGANFGIKNRVRARVQNLKVNGQTTYVTWARNSVFQNPNTVAVFDLLETLLTGRGQKFESWASLILAFAQFAMAVESGSSSGGDASLKSHCVIRSA
jgi:hypothetical protein